MLQYYNFENTNQNGKNLKYEPLYPRQVPIITMNVIDNLKRTVTFVERTRAIFSIIAYNTSEQKLREAARKSGTALRQGNY